MIARKFMVDFLNQNNKVKSDIILHIQMHVRTLINQQNLPKDKLRKTTSHTINPPHKI